MTFFKPSPEFARWLAGYAGERVVVDCGCGDGTLLAALLAAGHRAVGIDPRAGDDLFARFLLTGVHVVALEAEAMGGLVSGPGSLPVFARPCHNGFVARTLDLHRPPEALYVSKPENLRADVPRSFDARWLRGAPPCREERVYRVTPRAAAAARRKRRGPCRSEA